MVKSVGVSQQDSDPPELLMLNVFIYCAQGFFYVEICISKRFLHLSAQQPCFCVSSTEILHDLYVAQGRCGCRIPPSISFKGPLLLYFLPEWNYWEDEE